MTPEEAERQFGPLLADPTKPSVDIEKYVAWIKRAIEQWRKLGLHRVN